MRREQPDRRRYRDSSRGLSAAAASLVFFFFFPAALIGVCKSAPLPSEETAVPVRTKPPGIIYAAGPNQLTLIIGDKGAVRFGYETDNQFRAERRYPNGTVAGIYGFIGADGVPVQVKYGAVDQLGFQAMKEVIPATFPQEEVPPTTTPSAGGEVEEQGGAEKGEGQMRHMESKLKEPIAALGQIPDADKNSVSVESAPPFKKFVFPKIHLEEFANRQGRNLRSLPEAMPIPAPVTILAGSDSSW